MPRARSPSPYVDVSFPVAILPPPPPPSRRRHQPPRPPPSPPRGSADMGCAQAKPSQGSPARSHDRGIDHLMRCNGYAPAAARRLTDPLPTTAAVAVARDQADAKDNGLAGTETTDASGTSNLTAATVSSPSLSMPQAQRAAAGGRPRAAGGRVADVAAGERAARGAAGDRAPERRRVRQDREGRAGHVQQRVQGPRARRRRPARRAEEGTAGHHGAGERPVHGPRDAHPPPARPPQHHPPRRHRHLRMHRSIYLVFEFMYSDLSRLIARPLTTPQIKCYMQQLLMGLQHCHERNILHRDIKGSNLLIDRAGVLKIGDLGLANYYGRPAPPAHHPRGHPLVPRPSCCWVPPTTAWASTSGAPAASWPRCSPASR
ncbi:hypothetical protein ZWY2020_057420 [Hordeum vulgare]|nr:hypothetical protein ZWY2020_057420 [Hordeum vulgare]